MAKNATVQPKELTTAEVADKLGITRRAVVGLIQRGRFPNMRKLPASNGTYLIPYSDFESYLVVREARRKKSSARPEKGQALSHY